MRVLRMFNMYRGLPKSIYVLFFARIVNSMGMFVYPFLTFFLSQKMGFESDRVGFFMLLASTAYIPGSIVGGKLTDLFGRKRILLTFQSLAAVTFITCGFLGVSMAVPWLLITAGFLSAVSEPASSAMVADLTNPKNRKEAFSLLYLGINIGVAIGPMIAGFLFENYMRWIFWGDGITSLISLSLVLIFVNETIPDREKIEETKNIVDSDERAEEGSVFSAILKRPFLLAFAIINSLLAFSYAQHSFSIPLQLEKIPNLNDAIVFGTIMTTNAIVVLTMTIPLTALTKKFKSILNVSLAGILYAMGFGMIYFINAHWLFILSTILWTMGEILTVTNTSTYIANHSPITHRGRFNSIINIISGTGYATGPLLMGIYIKSYGVRMVWPFIFFLSLVGALLLFILYRIELRVKQRGTIMN